MYEKTDCAKRSELVFQWPVIEKRNAARRIMDDSSNTIRVGKNVVVKKMSRLTLTIAST